MRNKRNTLVVKFFRPYTFSHLLSVIDFTRIELVVCTLVNGVSPTIDDFCMEPLIKLQTN